MPKKASLEVAGVVARGDPAVAGADPGAERVRRDVEPAPAEVEADGRRHCLAEDPLPVDRVTRARGATASGRDSAPAIAATSGDELAPQRLEQGGDLAALGPRLVLVEQGVVGGAPGRRGTRPRAASAPTIFSSHGRNRAKSLARRASIHSCWATDVVRASSSTSVRGSRVLRS